MNSTSIDEVEGLCGGLVIEEVPDRWEINDMCHVQPDHGRGLVTGLVRRGEQALVNEHQQDVALLIVPVLVLGLA